VLEGPNEPEEGMLEYEKAGRAFVVRQKEVA